MTKLSISPAANSNPKIALVTGAARRIGSHIALALARAGWDVVVHYRDSAAA
ncbi:MAG: short-chain dehydrogenase, partial [Herbaspirillum sp.]